MQIRPATIEDCDGLLHIRNHYVTASFAVFDEEPLAHETVARVRIQPHPTAWM